MLWNKSDTTKTYTLSEYNILRIHEAKLSKLNKNVPCLFNGRTCSFYVINFSSFLIIGATVYYFFITYIISLK